MALTFTEEAGKEKVDYGRIEDGSYVARIVRIIDLGVQHNTNFRTSKPQYHVLDAAGKWKKNGNDFMYTDEVTSAPDLSHKLWIDFEFPTEVIEIDGAEKPRWQGKEFTFSMNEKAALYKLVHAADPGLKKTLKGRNPAGILGCPLMVTIASTSGGKAKITTVSPLIKGMEVAPLANPTLFFDLDSNDRKTFDSLPDWMKKRIQEGVGYDTTAFAKSAGDFSTMEEDPVEEDSPY